LPPKLKKGVILMMLRNALSGLLAVIVVMLTGAYINANAPRVANLAMAENDVKVQQPGSTAWIAATKGMPIYEGSVIKTGAQSKALVRLDDGSMSKVAPLSVLKIAAMSQRASGAKDTTLGVNVGKAWNRVNKLRDQSEFKIDTPSAVAGIRGTYKSTEVSRNADADFDMYEGESLVQAKSDGSTAVLKANQGLTVGSGSGVGDIRSARPDSDGISSTDAERYKFDLDVKVTPDIVRRGETAKVQVQLLRNGEPYPGRASFKVSLGGSALFKENGAKTVDVQSNDSGYAEMEITNDKEEKVSVSIEVSLTVTQ
jgi:hypothetical protein